MNPLKCTFGVTAGNFLGFLVHRKGIEVDKNKARAIINASPPKNKKELQRFLGQVNFLRHFEPSRECQGFFSSSEDEAPIVSGIPLGARASGSI